MALEGRRVLFISYNGMLEPLGQTQVIPYLRGLARRGVQFTLLSFEKENAFTSEGARNAANLRNELEVEGIEWHYLRYHQRPSLPATLFDVLHGIRYAGRLVQNKQIEMVHARGYIPAAIALSLKKKFKIKMIFDLRGLMAEEYVDALHWPKGGVRYRLTKRTERSIFATTDAIVTLTERIWPIINQWEGLKGRNVHHAVIPCCVDLTTFKFSEEDRARRRAELQLGEQFTLVYSGSLDGWYLTEEMADFFARVLEKRNDAHLLWLTKGSVERVRQLMRSRGIGEDHFSIRSVAANEVASYLSAGDMGISFIKRCFSKIASSPTKNGEYLACGLPLIINEGIGDSNALVNDLHAGVLIDDLTSEAFDGDWAKIQSFVLDSSSRTKVKAVAEKFFDLNEVGVKRYAALYESVLMPIAD